jgi:hypothetical protein
MLRSIRPKRARRPSDASVDPTDEHNAPGRDPLPSTYQTWTVRSLPHEASRWLSAFKAAHVTNCSWPRH